MVPFQLDAELSPIEENPSDQSIVHLTIEVNHQLEAIFDHADAPVHNSIIYAFHPVNHKALRLLPFKVPISTL
jgi:hypothetical protein